MTRDSHFDLFEDHTLIKHFLLDVYLKAWATILLSHFRQVWFVDAFAGEGSDAAGNPGSPLIAARIAADINATRFPTGLTANTGMRIAAFESHHDRYERLVTVMEQYTAPARPWPQTIAIVREGTLEERMDLVLGHLRGTPVLYFLDPFGIDGLSAAMLPRLLEGAHNELLILFADEGAVRLAGKVRAGLPDEAETIAAAEAAVPFSLFGEEETEKARDEARAAAKRSIAGHKSNPNAETIMDRAFGGPWWRPIIDATPEDERQAKFVELYEQLLSKCGASRILSFAIATADGRHKYFLIHASRDRRAFATMKDKMHRTRNKVSPPAEPGLLQQFDTQTNIREVADLIALHFAGRTVRWTGVKPCVQDFAIEETALWKHEFEALKAELLSRQFTHLNKAGKTQSPITFTFPAIAD